MEEEGGKREEERERRRGRGGGRGGLGEREGKRNKINIISCIIVAWVQLDLKD